jgi:hypothetical protein
VALGSSATLKPAAWDLDNSCDHKCLDSFIIIIMSSFEMVPSGYKNSDSTSGPGFDSPWERISQDLTAFLLSLVGGVPVDSETPVVTLSILRICRHSLRKCS